MGIGLLGRKIGMTQVYETTGKVVPVTVIQLGPCDVLQVKTLERDGYEAVQLGYGDKSRRAATRAERGHVANIDSKRQKARIAAGIESAAKANCEPKTFVKEFRVPVEGFSVGQKLNVSVFDGVTAVDVTSVSKGRGYAGTMTRHNFAGQRASHGVKKCHRHMGGTGCSAYPSRVLKGKRMPGQYGAKQVTQRNIALVSCDAENNLVLIKGAVPGPNGGFVSVRPTNMLPRPRKFDGTLVSVEN
ncbi:MAG: 50S ribosomal protein L3 [Planctomycetia bacterium]|nr:50S ribosomal protein L3 [Planctomycetia bacterium]